MLMIIDKLLNDLPKVILYEHGKGNLNWSLRDPADLKFFTINCECGVNKIKVDFVLDETTENINTSEMSVSNSLGKIFDKEGHKYGKVSNEDIKNLCDLLYKEILSPHLKKKEAELKSIIKNISPDYYRENNLKNLLD